ncbi:pyridoxine 5'-phosphate oxidase [Ventosimonas gracilis]|uniref:Pyridoxine/pyridoxamine 5'-phosphate oxidase n=1 Tax=Ventosimonas gracilis TaxID=1680762 RepID=A0A139SVP9_9GAMM|nr:pyridoxamine 5'-phosphate oxidase [Ventosimonas gracilis]KXU38540.1 pyridoxine 5'-phosphate oxidase [Ventosimonas gracilis]
MPQSLKPSLADMRRDYTKDGLNEADAPAGPLALFQQWFDQACKTEQLPIEPNAMSLATVDAQGRPHCRTVLLKGFDKKGFSFFGNYQSAKGQQLVANPLAALCLFWPTLERQVRIEGQVERLTPEESDAYFHSRPLGSRIGAWASPQSQMIASREVLQRQLTETEQRFASDDPPRPPHWGGWRLLPDCIEFWQGRASRLHDRLRYRLNGEKWLRERLAP